MTKQEYFDMCDELAKKESHLIEESNAYRDIRKPSKFSSSIKLTAHSASELSNSVQQELDSGEIPTTFIEGPLSHLWD